MELEWQIWVIMPTLGIPATFLEAEAHKQCISNVRSIHLREENFVVKYRMLAIRFSPFVLILVCYLRVLYSCSDTYIYDDILYTHTVNIGTVSIFPSVTSTVTRTAGDNFVLVCRADNIIPNPPPEDVTFEWFFGPRNSSLPTGVTVSNVTNTSGTYSSTLQFSPLLLSHAGMYTYRLWNSSHIASANITVFSKRTNFVAFIRLLILYL